MSGPLRDPLPPPESEHARFLRLFITCAGGLIGRIPSPVAPG